MAEARPNPAHVALARLEERRDVTVVTQNIDGLHAAAGSTEVIEFHGSIWRVRCVQCRRVEERREAPLREIPPRCGCGGLVRPDVVWFGEMLPPEVVRESVEAVTRAEAVLVVGSSMQVYPAADLARIAYEHRIPVIELNLEPSEARHFAAAFLAGKAGETLPALLEGAPI
jgi:NAD-dependent deacetylase